MEHAPSFRDSLYADIQPSYNDSLAHHGIKGMHWGVRRFQNADGSLTPKGRKRLAKKEQRTLNNLDRAKVQNIYDIERLEKKAAKKVKKLENKDYRNSKNPFREDLRRASLQKNKNRLDRAKNSKIAVNDAYKKQTQKILNRCKDQHLNVEITEGGKRWIDTHWRLIIGNSYIPIMRPYDGATKYKVSGLQHDDLYLMHHGIKGMHWGVRRYQNADGSYTAAGKARRGSKDSVSKKLTSSKAAKIAAGAAITAAGVAALAYMNNSDIPTISDKMAEKAVGKYCKATRKAAGDLYQDMLDTFEACKQDFDGDWPIDAKTCRTNAQQVRKDANDMFQAHSKSRAPFVKKAWHNSAGTSRRSKARADMNRTDEAIRNYRDSMLEYANMYDFMADELDRRRGN